MEEQDQASLLCPRSTLLSLKEMVIYSKIKMNEQELPDLDWRTVNKGWASWMREMFNLGDDACTKLTEPTA